ncbi:MAG: hypothetical protein HOB40_10795 [Candidatus Marinimicrobia bacterium]|jgi:hypothetical protein|nr:hypothetical protein [Candidatus Neomarinimicrobiota bacterium]MBT3840032.1 hypothetical protein [Candidatus Neomarinimicrobiota bacterium]MBT4000064.1 hypothetical protein [Candidatus Neomarinimicrobiota bacterium]MBT4282137.1 hypothetical protein [Candidatus Neomarinimicrobiota bacterium]MBT4578876.1 hypothetical protein [Candidatus Neomarinimicrobiota bacterium]
MIKKETTSLWVKFMVGMWITGFILDYTDGNSEIDYFEITRRSLFISVFSTYFFRLYMKKINSN